MRDLHALDKHRCTDVERYYYGVTGNGKNGVFKVFVGGRSFYCIASDGGGWEHVSVSPCNRKRQSCPTWDEMCAIKDMFFHEDECVVQYHPPKADYINQHPYCLHLWRPTGVDVPRPPAIFVGLKGVTEHG